MKIQESAENYLETIYMLHQRKGAVRSIDIVNELSFSKPSVSVAMKNLRENGYVEMDSDGFITLCPKGQEIAERMYERHVLADGAGGGPRCGSRGRLPHGARDQCGVLFGHQRLCVPEKGLSLRREGTREP